MKIWEVSYGKNSLQYLKFTVFCVEDFAFYNVKLELFVPEFINSLQRFYKTTDLLFLYQNRPIKVNCYD